MDIKNTTNTVKSSAKTINSKNWLVSMQNTIKIYIAIFVAIIAIVIGLYFLLGATKTMYQKTLDKTQQSLEEQKKFEKTIQNISEMINQRKMTVDKGVSVIYSSSIKNNITKIIKDKALADDSLISNFNITSANVDQNQIIDKANKINPILNNLKLIFPNINTNFYKIAITFDVNYEYITYSLINMIQQSIPGVVMIQSINIVPNEDTKLLLFNAIFNKVKKTNITKKRFNVNIELIWFLIEQQ